MTTNDIAVIVALLPLAAGMVVFQANPYHALVIRGILGAIAALVYAVLGAADVALTEALVGTMLAITLYAIAVRSSLVMRLGIVADPDSADSSPSPKTPTTLASSSVVNALRSQLRPYHVRLKLVPYETAEHLEHAFANQAIHGLWRRSPLPPSETAPPDALILRIHRLYEILAPGLTDSRLQVTYQPTLLPSAPLPQPLAKPSDVEEVQL